MSWNVSTGDLNQGARTLFHSASHGSSGYRSFYTLRESYYVEIAEILSRELPVIPT
ncbi:MAG TPA: hypothetical protein GXZ89_03905 [Fastidiosipila sp.]|nr:hypothetical protein [Fastidiosipila sp.]